MKWLFVTTVCLGLMLAKAVAQTGPNMKDYRSIPLIKRVLNENADGKALEEIRKVTDPNVRFLVALQKVILLDKARARAKGSTYINIGIIGSDGTVYNSGIFPADIAVEGDRKFYETLLQRNRDNIRTVDEIVEAKEKIMELIRMDLPKIDEKWQEAAGELVNTLEN